MSTQLSENTVKVKLSDLRKRCRDLLEEADTASEPQVRVPEDGKEDPQKLEGAL